MLSAAVFILYAILPLLVWICRKHLAHPKLNMAGLFLFTVVAGILLYVAGVWLDGLELIRDLDYYDLDGDGMFSEAEYTPEARLAMKRFTSDTGRSLVPFVAPPVTLIWVGINFMIGAIITRVVHKFREHKASKNRIIIPSSLI